MTVKLTSLDETTDWALETFQSHPALNGESAILSAYRNEARSYPALAISEWTRTDDTTEAPPEAVLPKIELKNREEAELADIVHKMIKPYIMFNPINLSYRPGVGPGTLSASFGAKLNAEFGYAPEGEMTLDEALAQPEPDMTFRTSATH